MHTLSKTLVSLSFALLLAGQASAHDTADAPIKSNPGPVDKVANAIKRGASAAATGIEKGARAAASGIERGTKAAAKGVERGASATGRAANKVADKIGGSGSFSSKSPTPAPVTDK